MRSQVAAFKAPLRSPGNEPNSATFASARCSSEADWPALPHRSAAAFPSASADGNTAVFTSAR